MNSRNEFIAKAIEDTQLTIRAMDVKNGALLAGLLVPFSALGRIWAHFSHLSSAVPFFLGLAVGVLFFSLWAFCIYVLIKALAALDNPASHVINSSGQAGSFYSGGLYTFSLLDSFMNREVIKASRDISHQLGLVPNNPQDIAGELVFEQLKLTYIRDIKIHRFNMGARVSAFWVFLGAISFIVSKIWYPG